MSVYKKNGRWYLRFSVRDREYNRAVQEATCMKDAEKAEIRFKNDLLQGKYELAEKIGDMPFKKLTEVYMEYAESCKKSWKSDVSRVNHLLNFFGDNRLREITPANVERYKSERQKYKTKRNELISNSSINREIEVLRKMFNIALKNKWAMSNPASSQQGVNKLRQDNSIERFLQPAEELRMLNLCVGQFAYLKPIIICALHTGMRRGEILNLKWENVNFKTGCITLTETKNNKIRKIGISNTLKEEFKKLNRFNEYVFTNPKTDKPYSDIKKGFKSIRDNAGIKNLRFHDLRHTAATRMVASGIDLVIVQDLLGHADLKTTQRYSHPVPERKQKAIEALENYCINFA